MIDDEKLIEKIKNFNFVYKVLVEPHYSYESDYRIYIYFTYENILSGKKFYKLNKLLKKYGFNLSYYTLETVNNINEWIFGHENIGKYFYGLVYKRSD